MSAHSTCKFGGPGWAAFAAMLQALDRPASVNTQVSFERLVCGASEPPSSRLQVRLVPLQRAARPDAVAGGAVIKGCKPGRQGGKPPVAFPRLPGPAPHKRSASGTLSGGGGGGPVKRARADEPGSSQIGAASRQGLPPGTLSAAVLEPEVASSEPQAAPRAALGRCEEAPAVSINQQRSTSAGRLVLVARKSTAEAAQGSSLLGSTEAAPDGARASAFEDSAASGSTARLFVAAHQPDARNLISSSAAEMDEDAAPGSKGAAVGPEPRPSVGAAGRQSAAITLATQARPQSASASRTAVDELVAAPRQAMPRAPANRKEKPARGRKAVPGAGAAAKGAKNAKKLEKGTVVGDVQKREQAVRNLAAAARERAGALLPPLTGYSPKPEAVLGHAWPCTAL